MRNSSSADEINEESAASLFPTQTLDCILFEDGRGHHLLNRASSLVCIWFQTHSVSLHPLPVLLYLCLLDCLYQLSAHTLLFFPISDNQRDGEKRGTMSHFYVERRKRLVMGDFKCILDFLFVRFLKLTLLPPLHLKPVCVPGSKDRGQSCPSI